MMQGDIELEGKPALGQPRAIQPASQWAGGIFDAAGEPLEIRTCAGLVRSNVPDVPVLRPERMLSEIPVRRATVSSPLSTGVRAIDGLITLGRGQRVAILGDAHAGRPDLLASIAAASDADVRVILLMDHRRAARRFIETGLGPETLRRSITIVAGGRPAEQQRAARLAGRVARQLCAEGAHVLLLVEPLPRPNHSDDSVGQDELLAVAGDRGHGSVTTLCGIEVMDEEAKDVTAVDGRFETCIPLSRHLNQRGYFPPIDVLASRWSTSVEFPGPEHRRAARLVRSLLADYDRIEELLNTAAYRSGWSLEGDLALATRQAVLRYLQQSRFFPSDLRQARVMLQELEREIQVEAELLAQSFEDARSAPQTLRIQRQAPAVRALAG